MLVLVCCVDDMANAFVVVVLLTTAAKGRATKEEEATGQRHVGACGFPRTAVTMCRQTRLTVRFVVAAPAEHRVSSGGVAVRSINTLFTATNTERRYETANVLGQAGAN